MRISLRDSIYRPQSDAQQTQLTSPPLIPLPSIEHEGILGELSVCPQMRSPSCIKSDLPAGYSRFLANCHHGQTISWI